MNKQDIRKDLFKLKDDMAFNGYDTWWHSFVGISKKTGNKKTFFVEYEIINPGYGRKKVTFGCDGIDTPSYMRVKAGCYGKNSKQINRFIPLSSVECPKKLLKIVGDDCFLSENNIWGKVDVSNQEVKEHPEYMSDAGKMIWSLRINKRIAYNTGYTTSPAVCEMDAFDEYWHSEGMKTAYEGFVYLDDEEYEVKGASSYGYADKTWGKNQLTPYVWLSGNNFKSKLSGDKLESSAFNILNGCPKIFGNTLIDKAFADFYYEGFDYDFNYTEFWQFNRTKVKCIDAGDKLIWNVKAINYKKALEVKIICKKEDMIKLTFENSRGQDDGLRIYSGGNGYGEIKLYHVVKGKLKLVDSLMAKNVNCEIGRYVYI